jgi:prepilin-type N-terminal cleavage/methylation domain-containing protein
MVKTKASTNYQEVSDMRRMTSQKGFTLVEIAIVLVIIGLLLGALLKGQEMIKSAKIKRVIKQADELRAAVYTYQDLYRQLPGDDTDPVGHTGVAGLTVGNGDGQINAGAEAQNMFDHLAAARLISGTYPGAAYAKHAFGDDCFVLWATVSGRTTHWIEFDVIPGEAARSIDYNIDDGANATGSVQGSAVYTSSFVTLYIEF